jgi:hypothetical protein
MCDVEHDIVCSPMLDESLQLIFQIYGLLSSEARYRVIATETLCRNAMADFAILQLGLNLLVRDGILARILRPAGSCKGEDGRPVQNGSPYKSFVRIVDLEGLRSLFFLTTAVRKERESSGRA